VFVLSHQTTTITTSGLSGFSLDFSPEYTWSWRHAPDCVNHFSCDFLSSKSKIRI